MGSIDHVSQGLSLFVTPKLKTMQNVFLSGDGGLCLQICWRRSLISPASVPALLARSVVKVGPDDVACDLGCGLGGWCVAAAEWQPEDSVVFGC